MDRTFLMATIVFVALAIVGVFFTVAPTTFVSAAGDVDALRLIGAGLFTASLSAFLVEAFRFERSREHSV